MEEHAITAIHEHLKTLQELPEIRIPNVKPADDNPIQYIDLIDLSVPNESLSICTDRSKYKWIMQTNIYVKAGSGSIVAKRMAKIITNSLKKGTVISSGGFDFHTEKNPDIAPALQPKGWYMIPVSIPLAIFGDEGPTVIN